MVASVLRPVRRARSAGTDGAGDPARPGARAPHAGPDRRAGVGLLRAWLGLGLALWGIGALAAGTPRIDDVPCPFEVLPHWPETRCAVATVPEDYGRNTGRTVQLPVVILGSSKAERPPLWVAGGGGPGARLGIGAEDAAHWGPWSWVMWSGTAATEYRQLVLMDNRGVGSSRPRLDCPELEAEYVRQLETNPDLDELVSSTAEAFARCRARLEAEGIDLARYNLVDAARDIDTVASLLGYEALDVYGGSYGSRVALMLERLYPTRVRSLVLDGAFPLFVTAVEEMPRTVHDLLTRLFGRCDADAACRAAYGTGLEAPFAAFLDRLAEAPIGLTVTHPRTQEPQRVVVTPGVLMAAVHLSLYESSSASTFPRLVAGLLAGNTDRLAVLVRDYLLAIITVDALDAGAYASYACHDEVPFVDLERARRELDRYPLQRYLNEGFAEVEQAMCAAWNVPALAAEWKQPRRIKTPMLLLSGGLDPATPATWAARLRRVASNAYSRTWPHAGHSVLYHDGCADWVMDTFLGRPDRSPFLVPCLHEAEPFRFDVPR